MQFRTEGRPGMHVWAILNGSIFCISLKCLKVLFTNEATETEEQVQGTVSQPEYFIVCHIIIARIIILYTVN